MHDQPLMRELHRAADFLEQAQARIERQRALVAVRVDRLALDVFHDEIRLAARRRAAVEQARDVRMLQRREDLPLAREVREHLGVGHAADQLDRGALLEMSVGALGEIDRAHAALARDGRRSRHAPRRSPLVELGLAPPVRAARARCVAGFALASSVSFRGVFISDRWRAEFGRSESVADGRRFHAQIRDRRRPRNRFVAVRGIRGIPQCGPALFGHDFVARSECATSARPVTTPHADSAVADDGAVHRCASRVRRPCAEARGAAQARTHRDRNRSRRRRNPRCRFRPRRRRRGVHVRALVAFEIAKIRHACRLVPRRDTDDLARTIMRVERESPRARIRGNGDERCCIVGHCAVRRSSASSGSQRAPAGPRPQQLHARVCETASAATHRAIRRHLRRQTPRAPESLRCRRRRSLRAAHRPWHLRRRNAAASGSPHSFPARACRRMPRSQPIPNASRA